MADFKEVFELNKDKLSDLAGSTDHFTKLSTKLNELGYDVLLNRKDKAEFIPSSRLSEVVSQRDNFKSQVQDLNKQLETMKTANASNEKLQSELQKIMDSNSQLLRDLESHKINAEIMIHAKDAINAKDVLAFINMDNIKVNGKGEVLGAEGEIARIRQEKPYLFNAQDTSTKKKGGFDNRPDQSSSSVNINTMIRRAAGRL